MCSITQVTVSALIEYNFSCLLTELCDKTLLTQDDTIQH